MGGRGARLQHHLLAVVWQSPPAELRAVSEFTPLFFSQVSDSVYTCGGARVLCQSVFIHTCLVSETLIKLMKLPIILFFHL